MSIEIERRMKSKQRLVNLAVGLLCGFVTLAVASAPGFDGDYIIIIVGALFSLGGLIGAVQGKEKI